MKSKFLPIALAATLMFAGQAIAAPPGGVYQLAAAPTCAAAEGAVYVRGAVAIVGSHEPVPGATVTLAYGREIRRTKTDAAGIYEATFQRSDAREVREVATTLAAPTGTNIPVKAREGTGTCTVPATSIGKLQQLK